MRLAKFMAVFMTVLVVSLPIYSASVFAALIGTFYDHQIGGSVNIEGLGGVEGYRNVTDRLSAAAFVSLVNDITGEVDTIMPDQLGLVIAGKEEKFNSCSEATPGSGEYVCLLTQQQPSVYTGNEQPYSILLYDDSLTTSRASVAGNIRVDKLAPTATTPIFNQDVNGINITFDVSDRAYSTNPNQCSGLRRVVLLEDGFVINTTNLPINPNNNCDRPFTFLFESPNPGEGMRTYDITVYDAVGLSTKISTGPKMVDATKPVIQTETFRLVDPSTGRTVHRVKPNMVATLDVEVNFTENSTNPTVKADFSDLGGGTGEVYASIVGTKPYYQAKWQGVNVDISDTTTYVVLPITAVDRMGNTREVYIQYDLSEEYTAPDVQSIKFWYKGKELHYLPGGPFTQAKITVDILEEEPGLDENGVWLNLVQLSGNAQARPNYCVENTTNNVWTCAWDPVQLELQTGGVSTFTVHAEDFFGNGVTAVMPYVIDRDTENPEIESFGTPWTADSQQNVEYGSFIRLGDNEFIAEIDEKRSGVIKENVKFSVSGGLVGQTNATKCEQITGGWNCYWENIGITSDVEDVYIATVSVSDNVGNAVGEEFKLYLDNTAPEFVSIDANSITAAGPAIYHKTGDSIQFNVKVKDKSPPTLSLDLSDLGKSSNISVPCEYFGDDVWECEYLTSAIGVLGPETTQIGITANDAVGNSKDVNDDISGLVLVNEDVAGAYVEGGKLKLDILEVETVPPIVFWRLGETQLNPSVIDRQTVSMIPQRAYLSFNLVKQNVPTGRLDDLQAVDVTLGSCTGENTEYLAGISIGNVGGKDKTNPYIILELKKQEMPIDSIPFECNVSVVSAYGDKLFTTPQVITVPGEIKFRNMPLGELGKNVEDEIEEAKDWWIGPDSWFGQTIGTLHDVFYGASSICSIMGMFETARQIIDGIGVLINTLDPTNTVSVGYCESEDLYTQSEAGLWNSLNKFCKFASCELGPNEAFGVNLGGYLEGDGKALFDDVFGPGMTGRQAFLNKPASYYMDPFASLPVAIVMGCIPGMVAGLEKYRQLECQYILCLEDLVPLGAPMDLCRANYEYMTCKYVVGEVLQFFPPVMIYDWIVDSIKGALMDPIAAGGMALGAVCSFTCPSSSAHPFGYGFCVIAEYTGMLTGLLGDLWTIFDPDSGYWDNLFTPPNDFCAMLEEGE